MKKSLIISMVAILATFCLAINSFAAWTTSCDLVDSSPGGNAILKFTFTGDGTALSTNLFTIIKAQSNASSLLTNFTGKYLYRGKTDPDDTNAPSAAYTITMTDMLGDVATLTDRSTSATEYFKGTEVSASGAYLSTYSSMPITVEDIGDGNSFVLYLEVTR